MKAGTTTFVGAFAAGAFAQSAFEPANFNITEALVSNGIDISAIPELSGLVERTLDLSPCSIAVGCLTMSTIL
jgi:hypothetical protein